MLRYILVVLLSLVFFGCSAKKDIKVDYVQDLVDIPQNIEFYTKEMDTDEIAVTEKEYKKAYFSAWNMQNLHKRLEDIKWPFKYFEKKQNYGENLLPIKKDFLNRMYKKSNFDNYCTLNKKALTLDYLNIRVLPTKRPLLSNPALAGEGFPFDYLQNSSINPNTPIFVSHYSKDGQWVFIFSSFAYGWVKRDEIAFISDEDAKVWQNAKQIFITKEGQPLFNELGEGIFNTRIGMLFSLVDEDENNYIVLSVSRCKNNISTFGRIKISKDIASKELLKINKNNLNTIINEISKTNYGWGGIYGQRDCSSTLMDLFSPFGIWLPRNSSKQGNIGEVIDIETLDEDEKIKIIKEKAIPFKTFLYKRGHIMLYVGTYNDKIIIFHNTWGIKTKDGKKEGRFLIGKTIFSTLKVGKELKNYDQSAELLRNIKSLNIITR